MVKKVSFQMQDLYNLFKIYNNPKLIIVRNPPLKSPRIFKIYFKRWAPSEAILKKEPVYKPTDRWVRLLACFHHCNMHISNWGGAYLAHISRMFYTKFPWGPIVILANAGLRTAHMPGGSRIQHITHAVHDRTSN